MFTKKRVIEIVKDCGGDYSYSGHTRTMYVRNIKDKWTFNVLTAYLFDTIRIVEQ